MLPLRRSRLKAFFYRIGDAWLARPIRYDLVGATLLALVSWYVKGLLHTRFLYPRILEKSSLVSFVDQVASASVSTAGFVFAAFTLLVSIAENFRAKHREEIAKAKAQAAGRTVSVRLDDFMSAFFVSDLYHAVVEALLWASVELFAVFGGCMLTKYLWDLLPDALTKGICILLATMVVAAVFRVLFMVHKVLAKPKTAPVYPD